MYCEESRKFSVETMKHLPGEFPFSLCVFLVFVCVCCGTGDTKSLGCSLRKLQS